MVLGDTPSPVMTSAGHMLSWLQKKSATQASVPPEGLAHSVGDEDNNVDRDKSQPQQQSGVDREECQAGGASGAVAATPEVGREHRPFGGEVATPSSGDSVQVLHGARCGDDSAPSLQSCRQTHGCSNVHRVHFGFELEDNLTQASMWNAGGSRKVTMGS